MSVRTVSGGDIDNRWEGNVLSADLLIKELTQCQVERAGGMTNSGHTECAI